MNFHVLTLFPEMIMNGLETSILGRAAAKGIVSFEAVNIRDYTLERHGKVDDYPYGGGAGMVMQAEPIYREDRKETACDLHDSPGKDFQSEYCGRSREGGGSGVPLRSL